MALHPEIVKRPIPYVERVVAEHGHGPLFSDVRPDKDGRRSTYIARKIDDWMGWRHQRSQFRPEPFIPALSEIACYSTAMFPSEFPTRSLATRHRAIGRKYEHVEMSKKIAAISKLPLISLV